MTNSRRPQWEPAIFLGVDRLPSDIQVPLRSDVPRWFLGGRFAPDHDVMWIDSPKHGRLLKFGNTGLSSAVAIDPSSRQVLQLDGEGASHFVNSSIEQFGQVTRAILGLFPFYSLGGAFKDYDESAARAAAVVM